MERRFCGKCGRPIGECSCGETVHNTTGFGSSKSEHEATGRAGSYYINRFDRIALTQGEVVVRQYHIGEFVKSIFLPGKGSASIIVTNKRVISKQDSDYMGSSSTSVEELNLESINGVKNYYYQGYTIWRLILAIVGILAGLFLFFGAFGRYGVNGEQMIGSLIALAIGVYMALTCRKPSYLFGIYAAASTPAMEMGANLRGKIFNAAGNGIIFQYKPTKEAVKMMCEIGACIIDLKTNGDYAIDAWKNI